jgi:hypothetical protein
MPTLSFFPQRVDLSTSLRYLLGASFLLLWLLAPACSPIDEPSHEHHHAHPPDSDLAVSRHELINCTESQATGYRQGTAFPITVVHIDGKPVEKKTANAYAVMRDAAARAGITLRVISGFRTMSEQQYLYNCYRNCNCNNCNLAARPGYSNHQSGHALDLNTSASGVYNWLAANAGRFGFQRTVPSEPWHWEWWGGGPGGGPCGSCVRRCDGSHIIDEKCGRGDCAVFGARCVNDNLGVRCVSVFCPNQGTKQVCLNDKIIGSCKDGGISTGDCSAFGSRCVSDNLGARCVFVFCPDQGKKNVCLSDREIGQCDNGKLGKGDCGAFGAYCSIAGVSSARCVSVFCVANPLEIPKKHSVCLPNGDIGHCDTNGGITVKKCASGKSCQNSPTPRCIGASKPRGFLDSVSCDGIKGWAQDPDEPKKSINVHLYFRGPAGDPDARGLSITADQHRADLCTQLGSCTHGFQIEPPYSLFNRREHPIHAYGIDSEGGENTQLSSSPRTFLCAPPILEGVKRPLIEEETFETWEFSVFWDLIPAPDQALTHLAEGTPLAKKPRIVRADDGTPEIWLIDGYLRRHIPSQKAFSAWHFKNADVEKWPAQQLYAFLEGTPLRPRPMLVEDSQGQTYLIDDPQPQLPTGTEPPSSPEMPEPRAEEEPPPIEEDESAEPDAASLPEIEFVTEPTTEILNIESGKEPQPHTRPPQGCECQQAPIAPLPLLLLFALIRLRRKRRPN